MPERPIWCCICSTDCVFFKIQTVACFHYSLLAFWCRAGHVVVLTLPGFAISGSPASGAVFQASVCWGMHKSAGCWMPSANALWFSQIQSVSLSDITTRLAGRHVQLKRGIRARWVGFIALINASIGQRPHEIDGLWYTRVIYPLFNKRKNVIKNIIISGFRLAFFPDVVSWTVDEFQNSRDSVWPDVF